MSFFIFKITIHSRSVIMIKPSTGFYNPKFYTQQIRIIVFLINGIEKARGNSPLIQTHQLKILWHPFIAFGLPLLGSITLSFFKG
jgi:hypothetical protein